VSRSGAGADAVPSAMITGATGGIGRAAGVTATAIAPGYVDTEMSAWVHDRIGPAEMIPPADIAGLILALTQMSARSVIPLVAMSRPGETHWRA
jgi:3-oxoacyl-[acyl-carrier protein] reductase